MGLKDLYHSLEDKWYAFLDKVDSVVPVYRVIDPLDKIIPSFLLLIIVAFLATIWFSAGILNVGGLGGNTDVVLNFRDEQGNNLNGVTATIVYAGNTLTKTTNSVGNVVLSGIPVGTSLNVTVSDPAFDPLNDTQVVEKANEKLIFTLASKTIHPSELSFQFVDAGGLSLGGKNIYVQLTCTSGTDLPQAQYTVTTGVLSLMPPADCGTLVGSVNANGYLKKDGVVFSNENNIITLQGEVLAKGKVKVTVRASEDNHVLPDMSVELLSNNGVTYNTIATNAFGVSIFNDIPVGEYYASVTDPGQNYGLITSETIVVQANQTTNADVTMSKEIQGSVSVSVVDQTVVVVDSTTKKPIVNATVKLVGKNDNKVYATQLTTSSQTSLHFDITDNIPYVMTASHPDYLAQSKDVPEITNNPIITFAMEKITAQNSGKVTITVKDEDGVPVDNAHVLLYDTKSGFIAQQYNPAITDYNGNAKFTGVQSGTYFARAVKYPAGPSDSQSFTTDKSVPASSSVTLVIGQATVEVKVKDQDGNPLPFAQVEFLTDGSDECAPGKCVTQSDNEGVAVQSFKADRKVYAHASANGFSGYTSLSHQLFPGKTETITMKLYKTILGNTPMVQFVDVQDPLTGLSAKEVKKGKTYLAILHLQIPNGLNLDKAGVHIRVGNETILENDVLQITGVAIPNTAVVKGTTYQPLLGYAADEENLTFDNAKWINAQWNDPQFGVYEIGVYIRPNDGISVLDPLAIYYRAWGKDDSAYLRDPQDAVLGISETVSGKESQYAETYNKIYYTGKPITCDGDFCFSGETLLNLDDQLLIDGVPYPLSVNKNYSYSFVLTSASDVVYENPKLRVLITNDDHLPSEEAQFSGYSVIASNGQILDATNLATNDVPGGEGQGIGVGKLAQYQTVAGTFSFVTKKTDGTNILIQLINNGEIVFEKSVGLEIDSTNTLFIAVDPGAASAFLPTSFGVTVVDEQGFQVQDALVSLLKVDPNKAQQFIAKQKTDITGKTTIVAPPSLPNTHFIFDAEKGGYTSEPFTIIVDENVVSFDPTKLSYSLPNAPNAEQFLPLDISNITQSGLILTKATISGDFQGFLSNGEMQNYVKQYQNTAIDPLETKTIQVKAATSPTVNVINGKTLKGNLALTFKAAVNQQEWVQNVPLHIGIKLVNDCDEGGIELTGTPASGDIETSAFDSKVSIPFQILNTCVVDGKPFPLKNLKAKITWKSNPIGNVELAVTDIEASNQATEVLKNGNFVPFFEVVKTVDDTVYESILTFTPFPKNIGQTADFTISIAAEAGVGDQTQTIDETFNAKIKVTNLQSCIKFDPEPEAGIKMLADVDTAELKIDTSACGNVPVDLAFCTEKNNENCRGGAPEGRLYLSQYSIDNLTEDSKTVTVERKGGTLPGAYDITVDARVPGGSFQHVASISTIIEADATYALELEKPNFTVYTKGAKDSSTVINRLLMEKVMVTASICDWGKASKKPGDEDLAIGIGLGAAAIAGVITYTYMPLAVTAASATGVGATAVATGAGAAVTGGAGTIFTSTTGGTLTTTTGSYTVAAGQSIGGTTLAEGGTFVAAGNGTVTATGSAGLSATAGAGGTVTTTAGTGGVAAASQTACLAGCYVPVIAVAVAVLVVAYLLTIYLTEEDPCDEMISAPLNDYVINLNGKSSSDTVSVKLSSNVSQHISGKWELSASQPFNDGGVPKQTAAVVVTNNSGYTNSNPLFGVMSLNVHIHDNGDPSHSGNAEVDCEGDDFGNYNITPASCTPTDDSEILEQKFHVKFKTQEIDNALPKLTFDTVACVDGTTLGSSGKGALPRVSFNWSWNDQTGIPWNACDASNPNHIYCDATQFNIAFMKRIKALDDFLAANKYQFECPDNPNETPQQAQFPAGQKLPPNVIGMVSVGYQFADGDATTITFNADVNNTTGANQKAMLTVTIGSDNAEDQLPASCTVNADLNGTGGKKMECTISGFDLSPSYYAEFKLTSTTTNQFSYAQPIVKFSTESVDQQNAGTCEDLSKSTVSIGGVPVINKWIDSLDPQYGSYVNDKDIKFTEQVPNVQALNNLTHFDAFLIRDGYSDDFENDFRDYYANTSFADAPTWFKSTMPNASVFSHLYGTEFLKFTNKYFDDPTLPAAGKYRIDIDAVFGDDWRFFNTDGTPKAGIAVSFYHIENPIPNSPFYRLPFDGLVGIENSIFNRVGYGMEYINSEAQPVSVNDTLVQTYTGEGSTAITKLSTQVKDDLHTLNSVPSSRGNLLEVTSLTNGETSSLIFSPSLATPVMMKVTHGVDTQPFSVYYHADAGNVPQDTGDTFTFWEGAGNCYDYSGVPIYETFNFSPDRAATQEDKLTNWPYLYAVDWDKSLAKGDAYLRTILYTPPSIPYTLQIEGGGAKIFTSNNQSPSSVQALDGITTLNYNNASSAINSIQDVFDLVADGKICVSDSGVKARFFWNPETLYKQTSQTSISAETNKLIAGKTCVGPPTN